MNSQDFCNTILYIAIYMMIILNQLNQLHRLYFFHHRLHYHHQYYRD
jgi:hypothetical protein